jgi:formylglycine-generating enzyme required for sulfatase activity
VERVVIPAGWFWMGWDEGHPAERPRHRVWIDDFAIARCPVTNAEYGHYLAAAGAAPPPWWHDRRFNEPDQPVVGVSWFEAVAFCEWLSARHAARFRLPFEAEWEKAARGGLEGARYPWGDERPAARSFDRPPVVTATPANPLGLHALSGVCHEWCLDWESEGYYQHSPDRNPRGSEGGTRRSSRGGAWRHQDPWGPVAHRSSLPPHLRYSDYGFRVVESPPSRGEAGAGSG